MSIKRSRVEEIPEEVCQFPNNDYGRLMAKESLLNDGLLKIGDQIRDYAGIRLTDFSGNLCDCKCTRVLYKQLQLNGYDYAIRMIDPDSKEDGDDPNDYTYRLVLISDGYIEQLAAIKETKLETYKDLTVCKMFTFDLYDSTSNDNYVVMSKYLEPKSEKLRKYVASSRNGQAILMTSQYRYNNPFFKMKILNENGFDD